MFSTTIVGSLPKPDWLAEPEKLWAAWRLRGADLRAGQERAALEWLREQEAAGIDIVSDGEQFRVHFVHGFLESVAGIDWNLKTPMGIRNNRYVAEVPTVTAPLARTRSIHRDDMAMRFAALLNEEALELQAAGADVIQFDEPAFNVFLDEVGEWGLPALERALQDLTVTTVVHICYGYGIEANIKWKATLGSEWRQYETLFPLLNRSTVRQISLEFAGSHVPHELLRLLPDKELLVGAIGVLLGTLETPEEVANSIGAALQHVERQRLLPCTNCGMAPLPAELARAKLRALGAGAALARQRH